MPSCPKCGGAIDETPVVNECADGPARSQPTQRPLAQATARALAINPDTNLVEMMTAELAVVEEEIARLRKREAYANQLRRMLAAAANETA